VTKPIPEEIREYIDYNPETGECVWKKKTSKYSKVKVGDTVGHLSSDGYRSFKVSDNMYQLHRVIWFLYHGEDPGDKQVDHMNGNRSDNRISNLRLLTHQENQHNNHCLGIHYSKNRRKWTAQIRLDGKKKHLGGWDCPLLAGLAYQDAKKELHPTAVRGLT
jgi:HNH endonuclease